MGGAAHRPTLRIVPVGARSRVWLGGDIDHGFQLAQHTVSTPVFGHFYCRTYQLAIVFFQLGFKAFKQRKSIGSSAGKANQHLIFI